MNVGILSVFICLFFVWHIPCVQGEFLILTLDDCVLF